MSYLKNVTLEYYLENVGFGVTVQYFINGQQFYFTGQNHTYAPPQHMEFKWWCCLHWLWFLTMIPTENRQPVLIRKVPQRNKNTILFRNVVNASVVCCSSQAILQRIWTNDCESVDQSSGLPQSTTFLIDACKFTWNNKELNSHLSVSGWWK